MKLKDVLSIISGSTKIRIFAGCIEIFYGKMAEVTKSEWDKNVGIYLECEVIRLNTVNGAITIAV